MIFETGEYQCNPLYTGLWTVMNVYRADGGNIIGAPAICKAVEASSTELGPPAKKRYSSHVQIYTNQMTRSRSVVPRSMAYETIEIEAEPVSRNILVRNIDSK